MIGIHPVPGLPEVEEGADLARLIHDATTADPFMDGDVLVVTQKVVSKAEGRFAPSEEKEAQVEAESRRVLRRQGTMAISETRHGLVCANAGIDASNVPGDRLTLLPVDPDASARRLKARLEHLSGAKIAVIISDTFGRPWRLGQTDVAIGVAGMKPFAEYVGRPDSEGVIMTATRICVADELAAAAELVMGKTRGICAAIVRGAEIEAGRGSATEIVRPSEADLFR